jgi:hypothetical protein
MNERQCVVHNVDQDHDMLTIEAHKLQTFLCQKIEMAQGHGGSTFFQTFVNFIQSFWRTHQFSQVQEKMLKWIPLISSF